MSMFRKFIRFINESFYYKNIVHYIIIHFRRVHWEQDIKFQNEGRDIFYYDKYEARHSYFYGTIRERNAQINRLCSNGSFSS